MHLGIQLTQTNRKQHGGLAMRHALCWSATQGDWSSLEGRCHVVVRLQAVFSKKTMWKRLIAQSVQAAGGRAMAELMQLVLSGFPASPCGLRSQLKAKPLGRRNLVLDSLLCPVGADRYRCVAYDVAEWSTAVFSAVTGCSCSCCAAGGVRYSVRSCGQRHALMLQGSCPV